MDKKDIVIDNCCIGSWDENFNPEEAIICFEGLVSNPCKVLVNKRNIRSEVEYMYFILPHVVKLFKVDKDKLVNQWVESVGYYKCFGARRCLERCLEKQNAENSCK